MLLPESVWSDPGGLARATAAAPARPGSSPSWPGRSTPTAPRIAPSELVSLHAELGPAVALSPAEPPTATVPPSALQQLPGHRSLHQRRRADRAVGGRAWRRATRRRRGHQRGARRSGPPSPGSPRQVGATDSGVAGQAPAPDDVSTISDRDLKRIVPIAVLVIGIMLALVLRSLVAPLYLLASVVHLLPGLARPGRHRVHRHRGPGGC